jgi:hypothetical protein
VGLALLGLFLMLGCFASCVAAYATSCGSSDAAANQRAIESMQLCGGGAILAWLLAALAATRRSDG